MSEQPEPAIITVSGEHQEELDRQFQRYAREYDVRHAGSAALGPPLPGRGIARGAPPDSDAGRRVLADLDGEPEGWPVVTTYLGTLVGAQPHCGWLPEEVLLDERGSVRASVVSLVHAHLERAPD